MELFVNDKPLSPYIVPITPIPSNLQVSWQANPGIVSGWNSKDLQINRSGIYPFTLRDGDGCELKDSVRRINQDRADLELIKQLKSTSERVSRYQKALSEEIGRYILEEHRKGHLKLIKASKEGDYFTESDLAKTIEKLIDDF